MSELFDRARLRDHLLLTDLRKNLPAFIIKNLVKSDSAYCFRPFRTSATVVSLNTSAQRCLAICRDHWHIENDLHWVLDAAFAQDHNRAHKDHAPENLAILQHIALILVKQENSTRASVKTKRLRADWDNAYLWKILSA